MSLRMFKSSPYYSFLSFDFSIPYSRPKMDDILDGIPHGEHLLRTEGQTRQEEKLGST
jgi:hypothetical protein